MESGIPVRRLYALKHEHSEFTGQNTAIPVAMRALAAWAAIWAAQPRILHQPGKESGGSNMQIKSIMLIATWAQRGLQI